MRVDVSPSVVTHRVVPYAITPRPQRSEGNKVVDCGHFGCFGRFEMGGSAFVHGSGLRNGRTEFPIGRSAVRTTIGKVRFCGRKVRTTIGIVRFSLAAL